MNILITGGAGYIGSHTAEYIFNQGCNPIVFDNLSHGKKKYVKFGPFIKGDLTEYNEIFLALKKYKPKAVIHFAGCISVNESQTNPFKYYKNNFIGTLNLLEAMKNCGINKIIFSSTASVYGLQKSLMIKENCKTGPINVYGDTKLSAENIIKEYNKLFKIDYAILRYFNASGANYSSGLGEDHNPETHVIPCMINSFLEKKTFKVYGKNFKTKDGTAVRDFIHVEDLAEAHFLSLKKIIKTKKSFILNLGTGKGSSVKDLINKFQILTKQKIKIKHMKRRVGDVDFLVSSNRKAKKLLKWNPTKSSIENILHSSYNWHLKLMKKIKI